LDTKALCHIVHSYTGCYKLTPFAYPHTIQNSMPTLLKV